MKNANRAVYKNNNLVGRYTFEALFISRYDLYTENLSKKFSSKIRAKLKEIAIQKILAGRWTRFFLSARRILVTIMITPITKPALLKPTLWPWIGS